RAAFLADVESDGGLSTPPDRRPAAGEAGPVNGEALTFLGQDQAVILGLVEPEHFAAHALRVVALLGQRKGESHPGTAAPAVLGPDRAAVGLDEPLRDRKSEARAAARAGSRVVVAPEALEHPLRRARRQAVAVVLDRDHDVMRV